MKIVIVGAGEVGYHIAGRLAFENMEVVVIDRGEAALQQEGHQTIFELEWVLWASRLSFVS